MKRNFTILVFCLTGLLGIPSAWGQTHEDLFRFSEYNWSFGTARSAAMGGAFTSLGADLSSMMLNPAGLGMYRRSEIGFTLGYTNLNTKTSHFDLYRFDNSATRGRFAMHSIGGAFNVYNGSGALTSFTLGFGYNKLADFNAYKRVESSSKVSMAHMFMDQMNSLTPVPTPEQVSDMLDNGEGKFLGAMLAAESGLLTFFDDRGKYGLDDKLVPNGNIFAKMTSRTKGSVGQYDLSAGMNFGNKLYLGLGFGLQSIFYQENYNYFEEPVDHPTPQNLLNNFNYPTYLRQNGSAWNFKIGTIIRPVKELRIGLAFHTPTYISMDELYYADMHTELYGRPQVTSSESPQFRTSYEIRTPMRFLAGASYTFYETAILSLDYERVWYDQMKFFWANGSQDRGIRDEVQFIYQPANNLRVGLETVLTPNWFARVGFAYYGGMFKDDFLFKDEEGFEKYDGRRLNYSAGFGYRSGDWGIDLAYVYSNGKDAPRRLFESNDVGSAAYKTDFRRHTVSVTSNWRF